jgi:hypothetical protein
MDLLLSNPDLRAGLDAAGIPYDRLVQVYSQGFLNALISVGLAFGLELVRPPVPGASAGSAGTTAHAPAGLLWAEAPHDRR